MLKLRAYANASAVASVVSSVDADVYDYATCRQLVRHIPGDSDPCVKFLIQTLKRTPKLENP